ncbi:MAG: hypothetical protein AB3N64_13025 [Puniceicoccaceae bacterium]
MNDFGILIGIVVLAHILLTPLVLVFVAVKQRRKIRNLEIAIDDLHERIESGARPEVAVVESAPVAKPDIGVEKPLPAPAPEESKTPDPVMEGPLPAQPAAVPSFESPPEPEPVSGPEPEPVTSRIVEFLSSIGMWPPAAEENVSRETLLMQWWLPRIGGVLALLSALFFAVYINQTTSPVFKCIELLVVSLAIAGGGRFLEKRYQRFGGVVMVTGLVMLYLTSVAAYVLPATRVIEDPLVGSLVQAVVLALICGIGLMRRSGGIVLLAFAFGLFLSVFMAWEGLREGALIAAILLFAAGLLLAGKTNFRNTLWITTPGSFLVVLAFPALSFLKTVPVPGILSTNIFINIVFAAVAGSYFLGTLGKTLHARILQSVASSLALVSVFCFFRVFYPDSLEWAVLALGCNMLAFSLLAWGLRGCGFLAQLLFIKAVFLIGTWVVLHFAGDLRWMVLALQTVVVAITARKAGTIPMETVTAALAIASGVVYLEVFNGMPDFGTFVWWMAVLYPAVIVLALAYLLQGVQKGEFQLRDPSRNWFYLAVILTAIGFWILLAEYTRPLPVETSWLFVAVAYSMGVISLVPVLSRWMLLATASLAFVVACLLFMDEPFSLILLAAILVMSVTGIHFLSTSEKRSAVLGQHGIYLLAIPCIALWAFQAMQNWPGQGAVAFLMAVAILLLSVVPKLNLAGSWSFLPVIILLLTEKGSPDGLGYFYAALVAGLGWLAVPAVVGGTRINLGWGRLGKLWTVAASFLFWLFFREFGSYYDNWLGGQLLMAGLAILLMTGAKFFPVTGFYTGSLLFGGTLMAKHFLSVVDLAQPGLWNSHVLLSYAAIIALLMVWYFLRATPVEGPAEARTFQHGASLVTGLLLFINSVLTFHYNQLGLLDWYTPILAVTAFAIIIIGLLNVDRIYRIIGLLALLVPLGRLFIVDVQDVLHRIIAFAAAAVVLTVLGYLYHRLSERLRVD